MFPRKNDVCGAMRKGGEDDDSTDQKRSSPHATTHPAFLGYSSLDPPSLPCTMAEERGNSPFWSPIHFPRTQIASPSPLPSKEPRISPQPFVSPPSFLSPSPLPALNFPPPFRSYPCTYLQPNERTMDGCWRSGREMAKLLLLTASLPPFPSSHSKKVKRGGD